MRDMLDTLTRGPFRDDTHRAAVEAAPHQRQWLEAQIAYCRRRLARVMAEGDDPMCEMSWAGLIEKWQDELDSLPAFEAAAEDLGGWQLSGHSGQLARASAEPVGGEIKADGRVMRVEVEDGRVRAAQAVLPEVDITPEGIHIPVSLAWQGVAWDLASIYDAATRALASAGPLPLASPKPWAESDQAYRARLADYLGCDVTYSGSMLDDYGVEAAELPRLRLVPATTKEGM